MGTSFIKPFLKQTITYIKSVSKDGYGDPAYTTVYSNVPARWQGTSKQLLTSSGEQVLAGIECWLLPTYTIGVGYQFTYDSTTYLVIDSSIKYDLFGNEEFVKVYLH